MDDISLVTYSHTICKDVWPMYLGQLSKHTSLQHRMFVNSPIQGTAHSVYDDHDPYYVQWTKCLEDVDSKYVIYMQEDFILIGDVDNEALASYRNFLDSSDYSFVRLIRSNFDMTLRHIKDDLYSVNHDNEDIFHMQATLWKKEDIRKLYFEAKSEKWLEGPHWRDAARKIGIRGAYCYRGEKQRGKFHFDSSVFPYICTAVNRGLWNMNEYPDELGPLLKEYGVDPSIRGIRKNYNYVNRNR